MPCWSAVTSSEDETRLLGRLVGERAAAGMVVLLQGPLGAGKTCFAQGVAYGLGVPEQTPVTSPSYALMNVHKGRLDLYHFDLYRLNRVDDLEDLGYDDCAEGEGLTLVEWADRVSVALPASLLVGIDYLEPDQRTIRLQALDEHGRRVLSGVRQAWQAHKGRKNL
jgi:tRNA threonylcarbamoyladenosine biosynthesis protein TsaE